MAYDRPWPDIISPSPSLAVNVPTSLTRLSFTLKHPLGQTMTYTVTTMPSIGSGSGSGSGLKTVSISGLKASTAYS
ncbi:hypothetical protein MUP37_05355 [Candidatus Bathyarchaeota archaeon]|nr:hypothetical protein [Candidatus Bathyarchaeota archaeon]